MSEKVLTIQRSKWRRGSFLQAGCGDTELLNKHGFMCCLGFDAIACGIPPKRLLGVVRPFELDGKRIPDSYRNRVSDETDATIIQAAIQHNDDSEITDTVRERLIAHDLKALGWDRVEFVD